MSIQCSAFKKHYALSLLERPEQLAIAGAHRFYAIGSIGHTAARTVMEEATNAQIHSPIRGSQIVAIPAIEQVNLLLPKLRAIVGAPGRELLPKSEIERVSIRQQRQTVGIF